MVINLIDTSDDDVDVRINDWLVENNFAKIGIMDNVIINNFTHKHYSRLLKKK